MKISVIILSFCTISFLNTAPGSAQTPDWSWAKTVGGIDSEYMHSLAIDDSGNAYVAGTFTSPVTIGNNSFTGDGLFVVKYDPVGNVIWSVDVPHCRAQSLTLDGFGNVYVGGNFSSDSVTVGNTTFHNSNSIFFSYDIILIKYDTSGNPLWARSGFGLGTENLISVKTDQLGYLSIAGDFDGLSFILDSDTIENVSTSRDLFFARYDPNGTLIWAKSAGGPGLDFMDAMATDRYGNIFIGGSFKGYNVTFDWLTLDNADTSAQSGDAFIAKYDTMSNLVWAKRAGDYFDDAVKGITTDSYGNAYATGWCQSGDFTFGGPDTVFFGGMFTSKFDPSGFPLMTIGVTSGSTGVGQSICLDDANNIVVAGRFNASVTFGNSTLSNVAIPPNGSSDVFVTKMDSVGNYVWALSAGGNHYDYVASVAALHSDNVWISGFSHSSSLNFGAINIPNNGITNSFDGYIAKIDTLYTFGLPGDLESTAISIYPNPVMEYLTVRLNDKSLKKATIFLIDTSSRITREIIISSAQPVLLDVRNLCSGVYHLQIVWDDRVESKKVVVID